MFAFMDGAETPPPPLPEPPALDWIRGADPSTAVVVDLPGAESALEGLALARLGYQPVPLYNGTPGPDNAPAPAVPLVPAGLPPSLLSAALGGASGDAVAVSTGPLSQALLAGTALLATLARRPGAPPAFLLDAARDGAGRRLAPGTYDNRWCVFPQDLPSAPFLSGQGVRRVLVRAGKLSDDLRHVLCRWSEQGLRLGWYDGAAPHDITGLAKPRGYKALFYRLGVLLGLRSNAAGGFGGVIPLPSDHHSRHRGYRG